MSAEPDRKKEERLVEEHARLVTSIAGRFLYSGREFDDLYQVGMMGLLRAIRNFDEERGVCFSTYAVPVIIGEIRRFLRDDSMLHVSRGLKENYALLQRTERELTQTLGRAPVLSELSEKTGLSREDILRATEANAAPISLETPLKEDEERTVADSVPDRPSVDEVDRIALKEGICRLSPQARRIITLRYVYAKTQQQTAEILGMTQVQVSRKEKKILTQLREEFYDSSA